MPEGANMAEEKAKYIHSVKQTFILGGMVQAKEEAWARERSFSEDMDQAKETQRAREMVVTVDTCQGGEKVGEAKRAQDINVVGVLVGVEKVFSVKASFGT